MNDFLDAFKFVIHNGSPRPQGAPSLLSLTFQHLQLSGAAIAVALVIAIPIGVWLGHLHRGSFAAINISNIGRALPSLAILAFGVAILGLGFLNVVVALVILAVPPMLTNSYVAVENIDRDLVDAARGMGMSGWEILRRVELPLALPLIFAGIRTSAVYVVATATITSLAGYSGSLGDVIANQASYHFSGVLGAAICVALLALLVESAFALIQRVVTPRGLKLASASPQERLGVRGLDPELAAEHSGAGSI
ncbi:MAG TPA: ABC transporter permease [Solirubrobacteraceae bacterium]|nr:ABC transporter permease [Solirubrobacteraceae bacterium]